MKQFFKFMFASMLGFLLAIFVFFMLTIFIISGILISAKSGTEIKLSDNSILEIKLDEQIRERTSPNPFESFNFSALRAGHELGLNDIIKNIKKAGKDSHITGIFLNLSEISAGMATLEEIRNALIEFKKSGKFIYAYSEYFTQKAYYLASVASRIYLNPQGDFDFRGFHVELMFFKGTLEKLDIEPEIIRHGKFKSAVEPFITDKMSPENREQLRSFVNTIWGNWISKVSESRKIPTEELIKIADNVSARFPEDALKLHLVDKLAYYDEVLKDLKKESGLEEKDKARLTSIKKYDDAVVKDDKEFSNKKIAVIYAVGTIGGGEGDDEEIGSERLTEAIRKARTDSTVKAIVLRVNSPGGSALASEVIWREVQLAQKAKPVVVSMGDYAASGGYYISCAADTIVAEPNTLTGSIGVFGLLFNMQKMFNNKLGITFDTVKTSKYADIGTFSRPITPGEREIIQSHIERIYDIFLTHVSEGRGMAKSEVDSIGQGRIWSGLDAKRLGLVDVIGGINTAIDIAAKMAKLENYRIVQLPEQKEFLEKLLEDLNSQAKTYFAKQELGDTYRYYQEFKDLANHRGIQARLPVSVTVY